MGCPKLPNRSQPLVGRRSPYYGDMLRRYCCLTSFFPIVDICLSWEDTDKIVRRCPNTEFLAIFCVLYFSEPRAAHFRYILNSHYGHIMCGTMTDIQYATAENRRGKKKKLEMWANAQCDGRPAEHRWRPLFNAAKFGWRSLLDCRAVTLSRRGSRWK